MPRPTVQIKLVVILDTTAADAARHDFDTGLIGDLRREAERGLITIALTEVQVEEMRAHVTEEAAAIKSVVKALRGGAGKKRIAPANARENDGVPIPRLIEHPIVNATLDQMLCAAESAVARFEVFLTMPYVTKLSCAAVSVGKFLPSYFQSKAPFGPGRKKDEFPDAISIETIRDYVKLHREDVEVHVVSADGDWHEALKGSGQLGCHKSIGQFLQYFRELDGLADLVEDVLFEDGGELARAITEQVPGHGFTLEEDWDADIEDVTVDEVSFVAVTVLKQENRWTTVEFTADLLLSAVVDYTEFESSMWDGEVGDYIFKDVHRARIACEVRAQGTAVALLEASTGAVIEVESVEWKSSVFELSLDGAKRFQKVHLPDPDDDDREPEEPEAEEPEAEEPEADEPEADEPEAEEREPDEPEPEEREPDEPEPEEPEPEEPEPEEPEPEEPEPDEREPDEPEPEEPEPEEPEPEGP